jgi:hypothetical protein
MVAEGKNGIFSTYLFVKQRTLTSRSLPVFPIRTGGKGPEVVYGTEEEVWNEAAVYAVPPPPSTDGKRVRIEISYTGDAARVYAGERLIIDNFYNGEPFSLPLWRIPKEDRDKLTIRVLPVTEGLAGKLPEAARRRLKEATASSAEKPIVTSVEEVRAEWLDPQP